MGYLIEKKISFILHQVLRSFYLYLVNAMTCIGLITLFFSLSLHAQPICPQFFVDGQLPKLDYVGRNLCFQAYSLTFSDITMTNLYSAELMTRDQVKASQRLKRYGLFDERDPVIRDYRHSGYNRGHMAPSGDMPTYTAQVQTFLSTNIVPQTQTLNSGKWNWIEHKVRLLALSYGQVYVVTGPYFEEPVDKIGAYRIWVPYGVWKAVYIPALNRAGVYFCKNLHKPICYRMSVALFTQRTRIDPFPALNEAVKQIKLALPKPVKYEHSIK